MYSALDIATYVINKSYEEGYPISNLKLQKILYFIQGYTLSIKDEACFSDRIEAWNYGPVVPNVYKKFKIFGANNIPSIGRIENDEVIDESNKNIDIQDKIIIDAVLKLLRKYSAGALVDITHKQAPWKDAIAKGNNSEITKESICQFFKEKCE